jgi:hypothetical protein
MTDEKPTHDVMQPPLAHLETRCAEPDAQLTRLAELRAHLRDLEAARCGRSSTAEGRSETASGTARPRLSEITQSSKGETDAP